MFCLKLAPSIEFLELLLSRVHVHKVGRFPCDPRVLEGLKCSQSFLGIQNN